MSEVKTLAIRLEADLHARLSAIAQLEGKPVAEEIRDAIEQLIESKRNAPELTAKADAALEDIEREASTKREALAAIFDNDSSPTSPSRSTRAKKASGRNASATT